MTLREFYLERRRAEVPTFVKVLKALPDDRLSYRPHDRSPSAEQIVWTLTSELRACLDAATQFRTEWKVEPPPPLREMVDLFERRSIALFSSTTTGRWYRNSPSGNSCGSSSSMRFIIEVSSAHTCVRWAATYLRF